jgi:hypothetical protein
MEKAVQERDVDALKRFARRRGGFGSSAVRRKAWPVLLRVDRYETVDFRSYQRSGWHSDDGQIRCDVDRSLWSVDQTTQWNDSLRAMRRSSLYHIIRAIMSRNSGLHYYQGFHDVVSVFVLVMEDDYVAFQVAEAVAERFFGDCMRSNFGVISEVMGLIFPLLQVGDKEVAKLLQIVGIEPYFVVSWLITWFAHDVKDLDAISRIFDVMLCSHPLYCLYICAALVVQNREGILECDADFAPLHTFLVQMARKPLDLEVLILKADELFARCPPEELLKRAPITAREELAKGEVYFGSDRLSKELGNWTGLFGGGDEGGVESTSARNAGKSNRQAGGRGHGHGQILSAWGWSRVADGAGAGAGDDGTKALEGSVFAATSSVVWPTSTRGAAAAMTGTGVAARNTPRGYSTPMARQNKTRGKNGGGSMEMWHLMLSCAAVGAIFGLGAQLLIPGTKPH